MTFPFVEIFTDGACKQNPGPGGWGALLRCKGIEKKLHGSEPYTSNNRMELQAAIQSLKSLKCPCNVILTTDSSYVKDGISEWIVNWKKNGWKTKERAYVKNIDLWKTLDSLIALHKIEWRWIKGHSGHRENELADQLANEAIDLWMKSLLNDQNLRLF